jgi:hypothetical protein
MIASDSCIIHGTRVHGVPNRHGNAVRYEEEVLGSKHCGVTTAYNNLLL